MDVTQIIVTVIASIVSVFAAGTIIKIVVCKRKSNVKQSIKGNHNITIGIINEEKEGNKKNGRNKNKS